FKMISLGADCVLIGRPFCVAAVGGLKQGVTQYLGTVKGQFTQAMVLTGSQDLASVNETASTLPLPSP
ncbi:MAG: alpha-hydroxy-acid oxidizing protein, partial [Desulfarculaceae bacterium]|nr:alpha-hydroxy-acid oxidizing protein [Desulfarculaceae bacterium]